MKSKKLITGLTIGAIAAVILIPKTRKMIYNAACSLTDALKGIADNAIDAAEKGSKELDKLSNKALDVASSVKETKHSWQ
jgi:hypothetical protein